MSLDPSSSSSVSVNRGGGGGSASLAGLSLECLINIIRALRMGSCLSATESRSPIPGSPLSPAAGIRKRKSSTNRLPGGGGGGGSRSSSSFEFLKEEPLHRIPGRFFLNGSTDIASLFTQQGKKGTNQDAMIVWENFASRKDTVFCGVFDGHGPYGHMVAKRVRDSLPLKLCAYWEGNKHSEDVIKLNGASEVSTSSEPADEESSEVETEKHNEIIQLLKNSFLRAFKLMDRELRLYTNIDCFCSGTTAVTMVKQGQYLVIGNVGDSRAVLGTRDEDDSVTAVQLTVDLKPNLPGEAERIRKCKGRVFALQDEPEVARVWLPNNDSPGLAMARAFGDFLLKDFGIISIPEISCRRLSWKDEFVVLATDGVWDVLSNKEVVDIVASVGERSSAARALVETAVKAWRYKYPSSKVDDCAAVCLFLTNDQVSTASATTTNQGVEPVDVSSSPTSTSTSTPSVDKDKDWSALDGVSRVNTLFNLPRFLPPPPAPAMDDGQEKKNKKKKKSH